MTDLTQNIEEELESDLILNTNDFLRPDLKQIGDSLAEIRKHFLSKDYNLIIPQNRGPHLENIGVDLALLLNTKFLKKYPCEVKEDKDTFPRRFVFLTDALALVLNFEVQNRPSHSKCEVFIVSPYQPILVLTLVEGDTESADVVSYSTAVARGVKETLSRFMDEYVNPIFGVIDINILNSSKAFRERLDVLAEASTVFSTEDSLHMSDSRYDKIVTAFWAGAAETKSIMTENGEIDNGNVHFLTKEQCIALIENINMQNVTVTSRPGCGGTTLMLEVARRLSQLDRTVIVCETEEERDRLGIVHGNIVTAADVHLSGLNKKYTSIINETDHPLPHMGRLWRFKKETVGGKNMVLIGKTGHGKSATGNSIICKKDYFHREVCGQSVTTKCAKASVVLNGEFVTVIDTPGTMDTEDPEGVLEELGRVIYLCSEGLDALVVVLNIYVRITKEEQEAITQLKAIFGKDFFQRFGIFIFTHGDSYHQEEFNEYIAKQKGPLKTLLVECSHRVFLFNNCLCPEKSKHQSAALLSMVGTMQSQNEERYSNEHFERARQEREKEMKKYKKAKKLLVKEKREREKTLDATEEKAVIEKQALAQKRKDKIQSVVNREIVKVSSEWEHLENIVKDDFTSVENQFLNNRDIGRSMAAELEAKMKVIFSKSFDCEIDYQTHADHIHTSFHTNSMVFRQKMQNLIKERDSLYHNMLVDLLSFEAKLLEGLKTNLSEEKTDLQNMEKNMKQRQQYTLKKEIESIVKTFQDSTEQSVKCLIEKRREPFKNKLQVTHQQQLNLLKAKGQDIVESADDWVSELSLITSECRTNMTDVRKTQLYNLKEKIEVEISIIKSRLYQVAAESFEDSLIKLKEEYMGKVDKTLLETNKRTVTIGTCREQDFEEKYVAERTDKWEAEFDEQLDIEMKQRFSKVVLPWTDRKARHVKRIENEELYFGILNVKELVPKLEASRISITDKWENTATEHYNQDYQQTVDTADNYQHHVFEETLNKIRSEMKENWIKQLDKTNSSIISDFRETIKNKIHEVNDSEQILKELDQFETEWKETKAEMLNTHATEWSNTFDKEVTDAGYSQCERTTTDTDVKGHHVDVTKVMQSAISTWKKEDDELVTRQQQQFVTKMGSSQKEAQDEFTNFKTKMCQFVENEFEKQLNTVTKLLEDSWQERCRPFRSEQRVEWSNVKVKRSDMSYLQIQRKAMEQKWKLNMDSLMNDIIDECSSAMLNKHEDTQLTVLYTIDAEKMVQQEAMLKEEEEIIKICEDGFFETLVKQQPKLHDISEVYPEIDDEIQRLEMKKEQKFNRFIKRMQKRRKDQEYVWLSEFKIKRNEAEYAAADKVCQEIFGKTFASMICFPSSAQVFTKSGVLRISDLTVGQDVLCMSFEGRPTYSKVYMFVHRDNVSEGIFIHISLDKNQLLISPNHYCIVLGEDAKDRHVLAQNVQVGDRMHFYDEHRSKMSVQTVRQTKLSIEKGLFAPYTLTGNIIVNNVLASCYVHNDVCSQNTFHWMLSPLRGLFRVVPCTVASLSDINENGVLRWKRLIEKKKYHYREEPKCDTKEQKS